MALLIVLAAPEKKQPRPAGSLPKLSFSTVFRDTRFWRMAPLSATGAGTSWSLQGLWAAPWLTDVAGLDRSAVVEHLTLMAAVLSASALLLGALAERLRRAGISTEMFLAGTLALSTAAQLALLLGVPVSSHLLFATIAVAGASTVLSFAILARYSPRRSPAAPTPPSASSTWARRSVCSAWAVSSSPGGLRPKGTTLPTRIRRQWRLA